MHCSRRSTVSGSAGLRACSRKACSTTSSTSCCLPFTVCSTRRPDTTRINSTNSSPVTSSITCKEDKQLLRMCSYLGCVMQKCSFVTFCNLSVFVPAANQNLVNKDFFCNAKCMVQYLLDSFSVNIKKISDFPQQRTTKDSSVSMKVAHRQVRETHLCFLRSYPKQLHLNGLNKS